MPPAFLVISVCALALAAGMAAIVWRGFAAAGTAPALVTVSALGLATAILVMPAPATEPASDSPVGAPSRPALRTTTPGTRLELLQLSEAFAGERLTVRGRVRNPLDAPVRDGLSAEVMALDDHGGVLATGRSLVAPLEPGGSSTFTIELRPGGTAARYRVSFRTGTTVVPHVDHRRRPRRSPPARLDSRVAAVVVSPEPAGHS